MRETIGVFRYEYLMQIRRYSLWVSMIVLAGVIYWSIFSELVLSKPNEINTDLLSDAYALAIFLTLPLSVLAPVVAGILTADRYPRDRQLHVGELLRVSLPSSLPLVLGRCAGSLLAVLTPPLLLLLGMVVIIATHLGKPELYWHAPVVLAVLILPSWLFIVAWSLVFPLLLPLRLYQVLYGGFWMWAAVVNPHVLPTINQSIVDIAGTYPSHAFFHEKAGSFVYHPPTTAGWAIFNMTLVIGLSLVALALIPLVQRWQEQRQ